MGGTTVLLSNDGWGGAWGRGVRTIGGDVCGAWGVLCIYDYVGLGKLYISGKV